MELSSQFDSSGVKYQQHTEKTGQRSLFQLDADHRAPDRRWPRGYSPMVKETVNQATPNITSSAPDRQTQEHGKDLLRQNLARSSAAVYDIKRVKSWSLHAEHPGGTLAGATAGGQYTDDGVVHLRSGSESSSAALHELGHAVSHGLKRESSVYDTPARRGEEEAYAQNYAQTTSYSGGYKKRPAGEVEGTEDAAYQRASGWSAKESGWSRRSEFEDAYAAHRMRPPEPKFDEDPPEHEQEMLFEPHHPGDNWRTNDDFSLPSGNKDWVLPRARIS